MTSFKSLQYYKDLIVVLTQKELKVRYKRSFPGYLWSIANPLALAVVFYVAFKVVMRIQIENYTLFLISGLFPWQWFSNSVSSSALMLSWRDLFMTGILDRNIFSLFSACAAHRIPPLQEAEVEICRGIINGFRSKIC